MGLSDDDSDLENHKWFRGLTMERLAKDLPPERLSLADAGVIPYEQYCWNEHWVEIVDKSSVFKD